jgi:UDP-N-acetylglucosamine acyltransferase
MLIRSPAVVAIDPDARVDPAAVLRDGVHVGPFCVVGPDVELGPGVRLDSHVVVRGRTTVGADTRVSPFAVLGGEPQHHRHRGPAGRLTIGADCTIREHVTVHVGSSQGAMLTRVGDRVTLMVSSHVGHDCEVGDGCVLANDVHLGGHVVLEAGVNVGGCTAIHQHVRIGIGAFVGGGSIVIRDVVPYGMAVGNRAVLVGVNLVGLRRDNISNASIRRLQAAIETLFGEEGDGTLVQRQAALCAEPTTPQIDELLRFVDAAAGRRFCPPSSKAVSSS